jgi:hypothetical protein
MKVLINNVTFRTTKETNFTSYADVREVLEDPFGMRFKGRVVFSGTLDACQEFASNHEIVKLVEFMPISSIPPGGSPSKKRSKNASARARHWKKTGVSDATVRWMEDHDML